jgi:NAD(P)-dependent dehydrogenase (short-subunit alcohol dehydrogenase family)
VRVKLLMEGVDARGPVLKGLAWDHPRRLLPMRDAAATRIALFGLGRALALEVAPRRIRVNMVCPGGIDTALTHGVYGESTPEAIEQYNSENSFGRIAQPESIAGAMVFFSRATHITGMSLRVDGGDGLMGVL